MQILINTDNNITGHAALSERVRTTIEHGLRRFEGYITRVEAHLSDENAGKSGPHDQRCMLEARPQGRQPVSVTHEANKLDLAVDGAVHKLVRMLDSVVGKQRTQATQGHAVIPEPTVD